MDMDDAAGKLYIVTKGDNALYVIDLKKWQVEKKLDIGAEAYTCLLSADHKTLFISLWGGSKLLYIDVKTLKIVDAIQTELNPNDICRTANGKYLYLACSQTNTVAVIDVAKKKIIETLDAALYPNALTGATTNSLALSADEKTLFIANADNNCLAVFDVSQPGKSRCKGFIPVGWYPTCVRTTGDMILVANGKGMSSMANPQGPQPVHKNVDAAYKKADARSEQYIGSLFKGSLSFIKSPSAEQLADFSKQVYAIHLMIKPKKQRLKGSREILFP
jgi:DNA-binding beta-propeller fold protein YncE